MLEAEAYARNRKLGLWALPAYRVLIPREAAGADGFQVVEGHVRTVDGNESPSLDLGSGFAAEVDRKALADFDTAGKAPQQLIGKLVRLRGPIRYGRGGLVLRLDHPEQVELLKP